MSQCHVWIVNATINNSVRIKEVKEMATIWTNSDSKRRSAPYMMMLPAREWNIWVFYSNTSLSSKALCKTLRSWKGWNIDMSWDCFSWNLINVMTTNQLLFRRQNWWEDREKLQQRCSDFYNSLSYSQTHGDRKLIHAYFGSCRFLTSQNSIFLAEKQLVTTQKLKDIKYF